MSIGAEVIAQMPIGADTAPAPSSSKPPRKRTSVAAADAVQQPQAR